MEEVDEKIREGNISLVLESYADIFSDFDPRPYSERTLSEDFLNECTHAMRDKDENQSLELRLLLPKEKRNYLEEKTIKKRLRNHALKHFQEKVKSINSLKKQGIRWFIIGAIIMLSAAFLLRYEGFLFNLLIIIMEPAGWFAFWEGLGKIFIETTKKEPEMIFYKKMSRVTISFENY